jgi:HEAT repeat protein
MCLLCGITVAATPYTEDTQRYLNELNTSDQAQRAGAAEALGLMRCYTAEAPLLSALYHSDSALRRNASIALGRLGSRLCLYSLLESLRDADPSVAQAAHSALGNLTGMRFPFYSDAKADLLNEQIAAWTDWVVNLPYSSIPSDLQNLLDSSDLYDQERAVSGLGTMGYSASVPQIISLIEPYLKAQDIEDFAANALVQNGLRALGRLAGEPARDLLSQAARHPQFAAAACDALGDIGDEQAAAILLELLPLYGFNSERRQANAGYDLGCVQSYHNSDAPEVAAYDRLPKAGYAVLYNLARIEFSSPANMENLREMLPYLIANIPNERDAGEVNLDKTWVRILRHLLDKTGYTQAVIDACYEVLGFDIVAPDIPGRETVFALLSDFYGDTAGDQPPYVGVTLAALERSPDHLDWLTQLLQHSNSWIRQQAATTLSHIDDPRAVTALNSALTQSLSMTGPGSVNQSIAYMRALGTLQAKQAVPQLIAIMNDAQRDAGLVYSAAAALKDIVDSAALDTFEQTAVMHPLQSVRLLAREALYRQGRTWSPITLPDTTVPVSFTGLEPEPDPQAFVYIKIPQVKLNASADNQLYTLNFSGHTPVETQITSFTQGRVADVEVSYDGGSVLFCHRKGDSDSWWHIYEIDTDGKNLRQITHGPYHDRGPCYMPDGRIVFYTTRIGLRREQNCDAATGLAVMNDDGSDIHCLTVTPGQDVDPSISTDGKILLARQESFYGPVKSEWNIGAIFTDGIRYRCRYGPHRRQFWYDYLTQTGMESLFSPYRVLQVSQVQPWGRSQLLCNSPAGPVILGPGPFRETILRDRRTSNTDSVDPYTITSPYPVSTKRILCAAGLKPNPGDNSGTSDDSGLQAGVNYGLYYLEVATGELHLIYDDPAGTEYEIRPLTPRSRELALEEWPFTRMAGYTGMLYCNSIFNTQEALVAERGVYLRVLQALVPAAGPETNDPPAATIARVLGTVPVAADGSYAVEVPADRLLSLQILDGDQRVVGHQLTWFTVRPGERKAFIGWKEHPDNVANLDADFPQAARRPFIKLLPDGSEMLFRAKQWIRGRTELQREERMLTVNTLNILGR